MFESIRNSAEFHRVYHSGKSYVNKYFIMYVLKNETDVNRFGIVVSKKVGNSVVRHRVTRLVRESIRLNMDGVKKGYDFVIISKKNTANLKFQDVQSAYLHLCKLHHLLK